MAPATALAAPMAALAIPGKAPAAMMPPLSSMPPLPIKALPARPAVPLSKAPVPLPKPPSSWPPTLKAPGAFLAMEPPMRPPMFLTLAKPPRAPRAIRPRLTWPRLLLLLLRGSSSSPRSKSGIPPSLSSPIPKKPATLSFTPLIMSAIKVKVFLISYFLTASSSLLWSALLTLTLSFIDCQLPMRPAAFSRRPRSLSTTVSFLFFKAAAVASFFNRASCSLVWSLSSFIFSALSDPAMSVTTSSLRVLTRLQSFLPQVLVLPASVLRRSSTLPSPVYWRTVWLNPPGLAWGAFSFLGPTISLPASSCDTLP